MRDPTCELCSRPGGRLIRDAGAFRVVRVEDAPSFPSFYRLIWNRHVAEISDLSAAERGACIEALAAIERELRARLQPKKVNLASLGNMVPHLHWHLIARFAGDGHFPNPIWGARTREDDPEALARQRALLPELDAAIANSLE